MKNLAKLCLKISALLTSTILATAYANAGPVGFATLNGGTTGGAGGPTVYATTGTEIHQALCSRATNDSPIIIHVEGTINHGNTSKVSGSCNTAEDKIEIKDISNVSIIGVGNGALFDELGIHLRNTSNIILQNLHIRNVKKSGDPISNGGDAIGMESGVFNVWVDHNTLEASGGETDGYDSLIDMKATTQYVTVSYNHLHTSGRGGLIGSSDTDNTNGFVTFHHNYYQDINSRTPLLRYGIAHSFNNYFNGIFSSGMNPRIGGEIKVENNHFENAKDPLGTFYTDDMGYWEVAGNLWGTGVAWSEDGSNNHPAGPDPISTTSIHMSYPYTLDDAACVKDIVLATAGAGKNLATSDGTCTVSSSSSSSTSSSSSSATSSSSSSATSSSSSTSGDLDLGTNIALNTGADGSSKADGSSYGNVNDGSLASYWQPLTNDGERISVKNLVGSFNTVIVREASATVTSWRLQNHDTGAQIASGSTLGAEAVIQFPDMSANKLNLLVDTASGTIQIAEFEVYNATSSTSSSSSSTSSSSTSSSSSSSSATCPTAWDSSATYSLGDQVSAKGHVWEWNFHQSGNSSSEPGSSGRWSDKWTDLGACS